MPGDSSGIAAFSAIPQGHDYTLIVDAPGFDRTVIPLQAKNGILTCVGTHSKKDKSICDLALSHGYLNGSLDLGAVTATGLTAQIVAEDRGTSNLENTINLSSSCLVSRAPAFHRRECTFPISRTRVSADPCLPGSTSTR